MPIAFTGERLHDANTLYRVDRLRHEAAYHFAARHAEGARVLDLGCGTGYGSAQLADLAERVVAVDRIAPDRAHESPSLHFLRADLHGIPLGPEHFDLVISFQVIEHLADPTAYLEAIASTLRPDGVAILTTPNLEQSDRENPFHVHEYGCAELESVLRRHFDDVAMHGVGATADVARYYDERLERIRRIVRLDPLRLRHRLPRAIIDRAFAALSVRIRRGIASGDGLPDASLDDFPIGPADARCLDLLAVCRSPSTSRAATVSRPAAASD